MRRGILFWMVFAILSTMTPRLPDYLVAGATWWNTAGADPIGNTVVSPAPVNPLVQPIRAAGQIRPATYLGQFMVTFYWMVEENKYTGNPNAPLYTTEGKLVGRFPPQFVTDFRTEACALLKNGTVISYLKQANRCKIVDAPIGSNGLTLAAMKSVAVDPSIIPVGSILYIPQAEDAPLGNGLVHNGIFRAHDIGSAIKGKRIDVYVGLKGNMDCFRSTSLCSPGYVDVYLLQ